MDTAVEKILKVFANIIIDKQFKDAIGKTPRELHLETIRFRRSLSRSSEKSIAKFEKMLKDEKDPEMQDLLKNHLKLEKESIKDLSLDDAIQLAMDACPPALPYLLEIPEVIEKEGSVGFTNLIKLSLKHMNRWTGEEAKEVKKTLKRYISEKFTLNKE